MSKMVKFWSNKLEKEVQGTVLKETKLTLTIQLENGKIIQKKQSQVETV